MKLFTDEYQNHPLYHWNEDTNQEKSNLDTSCAKHHWKLLWQNLNHRSLEAFELRGWQEEVLNNHPVKSVWFISLSKERFMLLHFPSCCASRAEFFFLFVWQCLRHLDNALKACFNFWSPWSCRALGLED